MNAKMNQEHLPHTETVYYSITGKAAHGRIAPLLPRDWIDVSPYSTRTVHQLGHCDHARTTDVAAYPTNHNIPKVIHFLWENAPRKDTKEYRNLATVYSHLPNGISILDDKWNLARLLKPLRKIYRNSESTDASDPLYYTDNYYRALESHVFRGLNGFHQFCHRVCNTVDAAQETQLLYDLHPDFAPILKTIPSKTWVIKDAQANGYGGIWFVTSDSFIPEKKCTLANDAITIGPPPISNKIPFQDHRYVAQKYVWPMVLYQHRKCHVRVYVVLLNGYAFVHQRCFLHVANQVFDFEHRDNYDNQDLDPSIHITNCCANSHDEVKFAGEICANLHRKGIGTLKDGLTVEVGLEPFFPSICASVRELARSSQGYVQGGEMNHGFEYLGLDFILSYETQACPTHGTIENDMTIPLSPQLTPVAYLLEVNCPPSQDTATGLKHAEDLHNEVLSDWVNVHVIPTIQGKRPVVYDDSTTRGWKCVYRENSSKAVVKMETTVSILPSKATLLNKIKWQLFERKSQREYEHEYLLSHNQVYVVSDPSLEEMNLFVRSQFPYFQNNQQCSNQSEKFPIFLENAGGSQVPIDVISSVTKSLSHRHRDIIGNQTKLTCRKILMTILGADENEAFLYLGLNATSLFSSLAQLFEESSFISSNQDIILSTENHLANVTPWVNLAQKVGMNVKWWKCLPDDGSCFVEPESNTQLSASLADLLASSTKIVCISHASNILGSVRDLKKICQLIRLKSPHALIICDGVAAVPHLYADFSELDVDFYIISCHKLFSSHLGALCARKESIRLLVQTHRTHEYENNPYNILETGTCNFEACAGGIGIGRYFRKLSTFEKGSINNSRSKIISTIGDNPIESLSFDEFDSDVICESQMKVVYRRIRILEESFLRYITDFLSSCSKVRIIQDENCLYSLPILSFVHEDIDAEDIVRFCKSNGVFVRSGSFLSTSFFQLEFNFTTVVRASFCHYNTIEESKRFVEVLKLMKSWS